MGRVSTAFRAFFAALRSEEASNRIQAALDQVSLPKPETVSEPVRVSVVVPPPQPKPPTQNAAVTLLATLQREARLIDFLKEDLSAYSDEQIGAAVRDVHRESSAVLDRAFGIRPILSESEGASVSVPSGFDAARYRLIGKLQGDAPYQGRLQHHGWEVSRCDVPEFIGNQSAAATIAPAEVEVV